MATCHATLRVLTTRIGCGIMQRLDKGFTNSAAIESKDGERRPLSSNKVAIGRSPSLVFTSDSSQMTEEEQLIYLADLLFDIFIEQEYGNGS